MNLLWVSYLLDILGRVLKDPAFLSEKLDIERLEALGAPQRSARDFGPFLIQRRRVEKA